MAYQLQILAMVADTEPASLIPEVSAAITADGSWERFVEVRMSAGPTVRITPHDQASYEVSIRWGSQDAHLKARTLLSAIECADRLAYAFYQMRDANMIQN
jgi:hypothetical protein